MLTQKNLPNLTTSCSFSFLERETEMEDSYTQKMQRCHEYIEALEQERTKIQVFQRELPLCLELVTQAIDTCRKQMSGTTTTECFLGQSECSEEQTSSEGPVLEEFIPMKRDSCSDDDDEQQSHKSKTQNKDEKLSVKSDWLRSVQLWNQPSDPPIKEDSPRKVEVKKNGGGAFHPFKKEKSSVTKQPTSPSMAAPPPAAANSTAETTESGSNGGGGGGGGGGGVGGGGGGGKREERETQSQRKSRRCWSPELHRRFLHALQQLGGSHVATPKQIRELMKVDGLTNDEVKSHLQKYRLHTRRPSTSTQNNNHPPPPQFVVVGGLWVPPPEYTVTSGEASGVTSPTGIYAPIASVPPPPTATHVSPATFKQKHSNHSHTDEHSEGRAHSNNSPATSSSTHTTTASPVY